MNAVHVAHRSDQIFFELLGVARSDLESLRLEPMQPSERPAATWPRFIRWVTKLASDVASGPTPGS